MLTKVFIKREYSAKQKSPEIQSFLRVYKNVGDLVEVGDLLFITADNEKISEYTSNRRGVIRKVYFQSGDQITPDMPVLEIFEKRGEACSLKNEQKSDETNNPKTPVAVSQSGADNELRPKSSKEVKATSYAKMLASKIGLSLDKVKGTGPGDWITRNDVLVCAIKLGLINENFDDSSLFVDEDLQESAPSVKPAKPVFAKGSSAAIKPEDLKVQRPKVGKEESKFKNDNVASSEFVQENVCRSSAFASNIETKFNETIEKPDHSQAFNQEDNVKNEGKSDAIKSDASRCNCVPTSEVTSCDVVSKRDDSKLEESSSWKKDLSCNVTKCGFKPKDEVRQFQITNEEKLAAKKSEAYQDRLSLAVVQLPDQEPLLRVSSRVDVTAIIEAFRRSDGGVSFPLSISLLSYFLKALARALKSFPVFNSTVQSNGKLFFNQDITIGLVSGASDYNKATGMLLDRVDEVSIEDLTQKLERLRMDKDFRKSCSVENPTFVMHDLMQFGSKNNVVLAPSRLAVFSVEDFYRVSFKNGQNSDRSFYFAPFTCFVNPHFIDNNIACEFVNAFKETFEQLMTTV